MELRDLGYLVACVDRGSFTKAARAIHVAQPTLSHAVKRLEDELGHVLLQRPKARDGVVVPTEHGALVVARAREILGSVARLDEELAGLGGEARGRIGLGAAPSLSVSLVPILLRRMQQTAPLVRVDVTTSSTDQLVERVHAHELDAAIVAEVPPRMLRGLDHRILFVDRFVVVGARDGDLAPRIRLRDLATKPLLLPPEREFHGRLLRDALVRASGRRVEPVAVLGSAETLVAAAREGVGLAILPERCFESGDPRLRIAAIAGAPLQRTVRLVAHRGAAARRAFEVLADELVRARSFDLPRPG